MTDAERQQRHRDRRKNEGKVLVRVWVPAAQIAAEAEAAASKMLPTRQILTPSLNDNTIDVSFRSQFTYPPKTQEQRDWQTGATIHSNAARAILALINKENKP